MTAVELAPNRDRVLVLCVEEECQGALQAWLEDAGLEVEIADSGSVVATRLKTRHVAALFIDRFPPPWRDLQTIQTMKRDCPGLRIVVVGDPEAEHFGLASAVGVDATLPRPLKRAMVLGALGMRP